MLPKENWCLFQQYVAYLEGYHSSSKNSAPLIIISQIVVNSLSSYIMGVEYIRTARIFASKYWAKLKQNHYDCINFLEE